MFFLAIRHLMSRKKQTSLTLLGIILGTAAYIGISGMMLGFQIFIIDQLVNNDSHLRIKAREELVTAKSLDLAFFEKNTIIQWIKPPSGRKDNAFILAPRECLTRLETDERVSGFSPQLIVQGIATYGKIAQGISLVGSEPEMQKDVSNIESSMVTGKFADIGKTGNRIAVGDEFLKKIGASKGETILLTVGKVCLNHFALFQYFI